MLGEANKQEISGRAVKLGHGGRGRGERSTQQKHMCKGPEEAEEVLSGRQRCVVSERQLSPEAGRASLPSADLTDSP